MDFIQNKVLKTDSTNKVPTHDIVVIISSGKLKEDEYKIRKNMKKEGVK